MKLVCAIILAFVVSASFAGAQNSPYIFKNGKDGYNMYRIPVIVSTPAGRLLAFCEGRNSLMDNGNIDIVLKTSDDNGHTWSALQVVWNDGNYTCGNPCR